MLNLLDRYKRQHHNNLKMKMNSFLIIISLFLTTCKGSFSEVDDKSKILEKVFNHKALQQYYHFNEGDRLPIYLVTDLIKSINVLSFGNRLIVVGDKPNRGSVFTLVEISVKKGRAIVVLKYLNEGLKIYTLLHKERDSWIIDEFKLIEN